ncbi:MAG: hypothetical protein RIB52_12980 [Erythrobacter sp.]
MMLVLSPALAEDEYANPWWLRVSNCGAFHCAANLLEADEGEGL